MAILAGLISFSALADDGFTVALRIRPQPVSASGVHAGMIAHWASGYYDGYRLEAYLTPCGLRPVLEIGRSGGAWMLEAPVGTVLPLGTWSHLAATWDGKIARLFVNGGVVAEGKYDGVFVRSSQADLNRLQFATCEAYGLDYYPFDLDDAVSLDRALAKKDIQMRVGKVEEPNVKMTKDQARLFYRALGVWFEPTPEECESVRKEWNTRPCNPYGPPPDLPSANKPTPVADTCFYVSPDGHDENPGTAQAPFATVTAARDAVRELKVKKGLPAGGVTVFVRGGVYQMSETICLKEEDSGAPGSPILYVAEEGSHPVFSGGLEIRDFRPADSPRLLASVRGKVLVADMRAAGYSHFEPMPSCGYGAGEYEGQCPMTDLYHNDVRQEPARWPNSGWNKILGGNPSNNTVKVALEDWGMWQHEPGLMITCYPGALWADLTCPVVGFDCNRSEITIAGRPDKRRLGRIQMNNPWFFSNALCALDMPGEWYLDRVEGLLYVMPDGRDGPYVLSDFSEPFFRLTDVHDVEIRGLTLAFGRATAIVGERLCRVTFAQNTIRSFGNDALHSLNSENVTVVGCTLRDFGHGGLRMSGGDRKTLRPAGHVVMNNDISLVQRWKRTYAPGLLLFGCGVRVERNHFHDMRSSAMRLEGNDFLIASNLVEDVVLESDDQGGVDVYANPTYAIRFIDNVWRNIGRGGEFVQCGQAAIRFDDRVSNMIVRGNRFENCSRKHFGAIQINCGRNNTIDQNVFVNCRLALSIQRMKMERWKKYVTSQNGVHRMKEEVNILAEPYQSRYPGISRLPEMDAENRFWRNRLYGETLPPPRHDGLTDLRANVAYGEENR